MTKKKIQIIEKDIMQDINKLERNEIANKYKKIIKYLLNKKKLKIILLKLNYKKRLIIIK